MPVSKHNVTTADRNAQVLAVLNTATEPLSPSQIAQAVNQPWCMGDGGHYPNTASISTVCKRIGAVKALKFGHWLKPGAVEAKPKVKLKAKK